MFVTGRVFGFSNLYFGVWTSVLVLGLVFERFGVVFVEVAELGLTSREMRRRANNPRVVAELNDSLLFNDDDNIEEDEGVAMGGDEGGNQEMMDDDRNDRKNVSHGC